MSAFDPLQTLARAAYWTFRNGTQIASVNAQTALIQKLEQHPELAYSETPGCVRIEAPGANGFAVELRGDGGDDWTVFLGNAGFHESFSSTEETLNFIAWCYSGAARVRDVWRGGAPQKSVLEAHENGDWRAVSETGFLFVPFWRERHEVVLENPNLLQN